MPRLRHVRLSERFTIIVPGVTPPNARLGYSGLTMALPHASVLQLVTALLVPTHHNSRVPLAELVYHTNGVTLRLTVSVACHARQLPPGCDTTKTRARAVGAVSCSRCFWHLWSRRHRWDRSRTAAPGWRIAVPTATRERDARSLTWRNAFRVAVIGVSTVLRLRWRCSWHESARWRTILFVRIDTRFIVA